MSLVLTLALALAQAAPTPPDVRWETVFEGPEGRLAIDPASIRRSGEIVQLRRRSEYRETQPDGMRSLVVTVALRCAARSYVMLRMEGYREDGTLIAAIDFTRDHPGARPRPFPADRSEAEAIYGRACRAPAG